ncbi:MAG: 6-phosphofructokinase [Pseudomonadota bacterium]
MKFAVLCSGGDAPGMNAAVWRLLSGAEKQGWEPTVFFHGYAGLLASDSRPFSPVDAARHARHGGAWIGVSRVPDFDQRIDEALNSLKEMDALVVIGGDGSLFGAEAIARRWAKPVIGLPATIDNNIAATDLSIGHDTALAFGLDAADRQRDSAEALPRLFCLETLGGPTGYLAAAIGRLAGAQAILIPEDQTTIDPVVAAVAPSVEAGNPSLIVASEGYPDLHAFLGEVCNRLDLRLRMTSLGHAQRGGAPTPRDRALADALARTALQALADTKSGVAVLRNGQPRLVDFAELKTTISPDLTSWRGLL